jgi:hypothetical protein
VVANGFSCQTQIADTVSGRTARHPDEVMAMARGNDQVAQPAPGPARRLLRTGGPVAAAQSVGGAAVWAAVRGVRGR